MRFKKTSLSLILVLSAALILTAVPAFAQEEAPEVELDQEGAGQEQEQEQEEEVVATVNGEDLTMRELEQEAGIQQIMMQMQQNPEFVQFLNTSEEGQEFLEAYKKEQLDSLIEQKLLEMEVEDKEIELTDEEIDEYFDEQLEMIKQQQDMSEDDILEALEEQGIESMDDFKEQFISQQEDNLKIQKLLDEQAGEEIEVTEEEMEEYYDDNQIQADFEEVKDQIESRLMQDKYVDYLREEAEIEKHM
ncbi:MAG: SurA N-terminal domain-containing protein [Halanaerobiales bacterium]